MKSLSSCLGLLVQVLRLGICVGLLYVATTDYTNGQACKNWPTVQGKLKTAELKETKSAKGGTKLEANVEYEYVINGRSYTGDRVQFGGLGFRDPAKVVEEVKSTKELKVHYKPGEPELSCIETGLNMSIILLQLLGALALIGLAVVEEFKRRKSNESRQSLSSDRQGKKLSSLPGLKEQKDLTQGNPKSKIKQAIFLLVFMGLALPLATAFEHIEIPGIPTQVAGICSLFFGGLLIVLLMSSIAPLIAVLVRQRHLALAETLANINAAIYSGFSSSFELALARGLQAEVAQERLQYDKALAFSKMALNVMAERNELLVAANEKMSGVLEKHAIASSQKQYGALESVCNESLGSIYFDMGQYDNAMKHAKEAIKMAEDLLKEPSNDNPGTKLALACALALKGRTESALGLHDDAKSDLKRAMTIRKETTLPYPDRLATVMSHLASNYTMREEYRAAERLLDEALQIVEGSNESALQLAKATVLFHRAEMKMHLGQYQSAQELLNQCIALREELLLQNHPHIAEAYLLSAKLSQSAGRSADAARQRAKAIAMLQFCFGDKHPLMANGETFKSAGFTPAKLNQPEFTVKH